MERKLQTRAITLKRINYGEADRIITVLTEDIGKRSLIAKGVRRAKSKLAAGIDLFAVNELTLLRGKRDLDTLISSRQQTSFRDILRDYDVVQIGYRLLQLSEKSDDESAADSLFVLLTDALRLLNEGKIRPEVVEGWFTMQLMQLHGTAPNLTTDDNNKPLEELKQYHFVVEDGVFAASEQGNMASRHIKAWRVLLTADAASIGKISGLGEVMAETIEQLRAFANYQQ